MKKSDTNENILTEYNMKNIDKYLIYDLVETTRSFFRAYFQDAVKVDFSIQSPSYIYLNGKGLAKFFREALKLQRGENLLQIYIKDSADVLNIVVGSKDGLTISDEEKLTLDNLAKESGFSMEIAKGAIIIRHKLEGVDSIPLYSSDIPCPLYEDFKDVFFGE